MPRGADAKITSMDAAMMGLAGTVVGAAVAGGVVLVKSVAETWLPGAVASADQKRQAHMDLHSRRHDVLREWRAGLAGARDAHRQWATGSPKTEAPNVVGAEWFESLRPYLSDSGDAAQYRTACEVHCDNPTLVALSLEIGRIEKDWVEEERRHVRRR